MTLPTSGNPIKLSDIQTEYGGSNPISISEYRSGAGYVSYTESGVGTSQVNIGSLRGLSSLTTNPRANNISSLSSFFNTSTYRMNGIRMDSIDGKNVVATAEVFDTTGFTIAIASFYSNNSGNTWTQGNSISIFRPVLSDMRYVPWAELYVMCANSNNQRSVIYTSPDGVTWTAKTNYPVWYLGTPGGSSDARFYVTSNGLYAYTYGGEVSYTTSYSGGDFTWTTPVKIIPLDGTNRRPVNQLIFDGTYWYAGSYKGLFRNTSLSTPDWTPLTFGNGQTCYGITYNSSTYEYLCQIGSYYYKSTDGFTSSSYTAVNGGYSTGGPIVWDPVTKIYAQRTNSYSVLSVSTDGVYWVNASSNYSMYFYSNPVFKNGTLFAAGSDAAAYGSGTWHWYFLRGPN
jgi:hypothetical protein